MWSTFRIERALCALSFIGLFIGTLLSYRSPATGYELSIYSNTPVLYWIFLIFSVSVAIYLLITSSENHQIAFILGNLSVLSLLTLPVVRGYLYLGSTDALGHLGSTKAILEWGSSSHVARYPALHTLSATVSFITGLEPTHSVYLVVAAIAFLFPLALFLCINSIFGKSAGYFAFISGMFFLPINQISTVIEAHPTSQALLYLPFVLFLVIKYHSTLMRGYALLILLVFAFFTQVHPQQAANIVLMLVFSAALVIILGIIYNMSNYSVHYPNRQSSAFLYSAAIVATVFWVLAIEDSGFRGVFRNFVLRLIHGVGRGTSDIENRGESVGSVGGSPEELFLKIFLIGFVFCILLAVLILIRMYNSSKMGKKGLLFLKKDTVFLISVGGIPIALLILAFLVGGISDQHARHVGFILVIATLSGSEVLSTVFDRLSHIKYIKIGVVLLLILMFIVSLPIVFPSDYIYRGSGHVTESQVDGFETTFEYYNTDDPIISARTSPSRYSAAFAEPPRQNTIRDVLAKHRDDGYSTAPNHFDNQGIHTWDIQVYVSTTESDIKRDAEMYQGLRYSHSDFEYLDTQEGINRIYSNSGYTLHRTT